MQLEWERIWKRVWLLGAIESDLREPGDFVATEIGRESVLMVRQADGGLRAFYNVCLHRGNRLRPTGAGSDDSFKCQYHHWEYALDGSFKRIPDLDTFPQGAPPCRGLKELPCAAWGGFVWFSLDPDVGPLASGLVRRGRLAELPAIKTVIERLLAPVHDLAGQVVLVTAGPTRKPLDPVRFLSNRSSGKMGYAMAEAAAARGAHVILVSGPTALRAPANVDLVHVETADEMYRAVL